MTKTKIVALLSVLALLASLPLTVALAQGAPYLVIGSAMLDDEPAMMGTMVVVAMVGEEKVGSGEVFDAMGHYRLHDRPTAVMGDTVMISLMMGEGDEAMEYMAMTDEDIMIGPSGDSHDGRPDGLQRRRARPPADRGPHADRRAGARGHARPERAPGRCQGEQGAAGEPLVPTGADGAAGARGAVWSCRL